MAISMKFVKDARVLVVLPLLERPWPPAAATRWKALNRRPWPLSRAVARSWWKPSLRRQR
jgi:hypothetical protein